MTSSQLLGLGTFAYLGAAVLYLALFIFRAQKQLGLIATLATIVGVLLLSGGIGLRWVESYQLHPGSGHAPLSNMYESLVFFAWVIGVLYLVIEFKFKNKSIGAFAMPFAFLSMAFASFSFDARAQAIEPLVPALQSNWLLFHVVTCFIGYAAFAVACGLGIMYLCRNSLGRNAPETSIWNSLPALKVIDDLTHKTILFGFLWLTAGIITGAVWANSAWGTYWSWDPKETWSLITWFVYAAALHARFTRGWGGTRIAWIAIIGFVAVVFTYYGVNYLLSGLHSYGGP
ncbi:MAG: c-type cytochrome biogenesis protein CcsB [Desulfobacterales bacterium]|nr:c-type cytochrome biogenesis protein CcsB [Desulfobacterales bacterium]